MTEEEELRRAGEARQVLTHPLYREAFASIKDRLVNQLSLADLPDDARARCNNLLVALAKVNQYMEQAMLTGEMAAQQIEQKRTLADRFKRFAA